MDVTAGFKQLFEGRNDYWGAEHGECVHGDLTDELWENHLCGDGSLGVYPLVDGKVRWGCSDIDEGYSQSRPLAYNLVGALEHLGLVAWAEISKSKGHHVWLFAKHWVPAEWMRKTLLFAHKVAGVAPTEVNPKQTGGRLGNYVNLPYAHRWVQEGKRVVSVEGDPAHLTVEEFVQLASDGRSEPHEFQVWAAAYDKLYPDTPHMAAVPRRSSNLEVAHLVGRLDGLARTIFQGGVLDGRDRSGTLMRLAYLLQESGSFTPDEAFALLRDADGRWGKFYDRPDGDARLAEMIEKAWR